jgi:PAS domain S-box-containing protein
MPDDQSPIEVLHVDDEPDLAAVTAEALEQADERMAVETVTSVAAALEKIDGRDPDCVVSDYDMAPKDGIDLLETVREDYPDLPFVLFTGKGSEEVASEAFAAGATDYLQKSSGLDQYTVLANRIQNVVEERRERAARRETEHRLSQLANQSNDVLWMFTADWDELLFVNAAYERVYGRSRELLRADTQDFLAAVHPDDRDRVREVMERTSAGEETEIEYRVNEAEDYDRWVWVQAGPITDEDGTVTRVAGFSRDITQRRTERRQLERIREFFENAERLGDLGAWEIREDGPTTWTAGTRRIHGVDEDFEPSVDDGLSFIHPDDRDRVREAIGSAIEAGESFEVQARLEAADGEERWVRSRGQPVDPEDEPSRIRGYIQDVTDRVERERELEQYETIVETIPEGVFVLDEAGAIKMGNERAAELLGSAPGELIGQSFESLIEDGVFEPGIVETYLDHVRTLLSSETDQEYAQYEQTVTVDGEERILETHLALRPYDEDFQGTIGVIRDVTEPKRQRETLREQNERLEEFASIVSHDLRNPLNLAKGHLELASEGCEDEQLEPVRRAHERMERLIEDLLTLARQGDSPSELEPVELADLARGCWQTVHHSGASLDAPVEATVQADEVRLRELLENLFRNAVEHAGPDVTVTLGSLPDGFYVADDGQGISPEKREDVFEYGYSTADEGTGLGLSIVSRVAEAHNWDVSVQDSEAGGARFEVTGVEFADD